MIHNEHLQAHLAYARARDRRKSSPDGREGENKNGTHCKHCGPTKESKMKTARQLVKDEQPMAPDGCSKSKYFVVRRSVLGDMAAELFFSPHTKRYSDDAFGAALYLENKGLQEMQSGLTENKARSLIGAWKQAYGLMNAFGGK